MDLQARERKHMIKFNKLKKEKLRELEDKKLKLDSKIENAKEAKLKMESDLNERQDRYYEQVRS